MGEEGRWARGARAQMNSSRLASLELSYEELSQIEEVLLRHRRTPLIIGLQKKIQDARRSIEGERDEKGV